ncbi:hypothetical protein C8F04DRAFT_991783, partial [Mycena alexandri]
AAPSSTSSSSGFQLQNGLTAQKLNAGFQSLTANSSCTPGQEACVGNSFAQCESGAFVLTQCAAGTICAALPLVNKAGTSIGCDTSSDVAARIAATGATGGITGSDSSSSAASSSAPAPSSSASTLLAQNGLAAQKLNARFKTLTAGTACTSGAQACIGDSFAQCVKGTYVLSPCSGGNVCAAVPIVDGTVGTSVGCDAPADVEAKIAATGVTGGTGL